MENDARRWLACIRLLATLLTIFLLTSCGTGRSPYPEAKVKSALGTSSTCAFCRKEIPHVVQSNMLTVKGVAYTVCDAKCAAELEAWAKNQ
jgi:hypothetical protein